MQAAKTQKQKKKTHIWRAVFDAASLFFARNNETAVWTQGCCCSCFRDPKGKTEAGCALPDFLPARRLRLLPRHGFILVLHQARCTPADLILPWRSSSAKSIYKDAAPSRYPTAPPRSFRNQLASVVLGALPSCSVSSVES